MVNVEAQNPVSLHYLCFEKYMWVALIILCCIIRLAHVGRFFV